MLKSNFILFLIKRILVFIAFIYTGISFSSIETTDCRLRLRYMSFDKMTENQKLTWLFCAYEKLKEGDERHLKIYKEKNGNLPNYNQFLKSWEKRIMYK